MQGGKGQRRRNARRYAENPEKYKEHARGWRAIRPNYKKLEAVCNNYCKLITVHCTNEDSKEKKRASDTRYRAKTKEEHRSLLWLHAARAQTRSAGLAHTERWL